MVKNGIIDQSAYYESLHELPLIANLVSRKKLYEMNRIISDTAEYGCYLFNNSCIPLLTEFMREIENNHIGSKTQLHVIKKIYMTDLQRTIQSKKLVKYYVIT